MKAFLLAGTCLATAMMALSTPSAHAASLESELSNMLVQHPKLKSVSNVHKGTQQAVQEQKSQYLPTVELNSDYGYEHISTPSERNAADGKSASGLTRKVVGISVTQNLFNGFQTDSAIKLAQHDRKSQEITQNATEHEMLLAGVNAYIDVLKKHRLLKYALEFQENVRTQLELENERVKRGSGIDIDVLNAKSKLQTAVERVVKFEGELDKAVDTYLQIFDHAPDIAAMTDPEPPMDLLPNDMDTAIHAATRDNTSVKNADVAISRAMETKRNINSQYYPTVDLTGSMNYENDKNATIGTRRDYSVLVEANWTLYSGNSTSHSLRKAQYDHAARKNDLNYTTREVVEDTRQAWHDLETNRRRLDLLENDLIIKEELFNATRKQRESGAEGVDVTDVLDRESELFLAKLDYATVHFDYRKSIYKVIALIGQLSSANLGLDKG